MDVLSNNADTWWNAYLGKTFYICQSITIELDGIDFQDNLGDHLVYAYKIPRLLIKNSNFISNSDEDEVLKDGVFPFQQELDDGMWSVEAETVFNPGGTWC